MNHSHPGVFEDFSWWDPGDVLTYITPARFSYLQSVAGGLGGRTALDLGCGGGLLAEPLARAGARVCGIDIAGGALKAAREHAGESGLRVHYTLAGSEDLPFEADRFDLVVAFDVLEHVVSIEKTIREACRVLRPGGRLVYDTMNRTLLCLIMVIWIGENLWKGGPPRGTHQWKKLVRPEKLVALLEENGVRNMEVKGFVPKGIDHRGRLRMGLSRFKGLSYVGYGIKQGRSAGW